MILIFGTRLYETLLVLVTFVCGHCGVNASQRVTKLANRFTLFFIPLFAVSTRYAVQCSNCATVPPLTREQAEHSLEWAAQRVSR